jgi:hypothetical protein
MRVIRYHLYHGLPGFVQRAENAWTFQPLTPARTRITGRTEMHVTGIMDWMMGGMMKKSLDRVLGEMCTEAKPIIETGEPHP